MSTYADQHGDYHQLQYDNDDVSSSITLLPNFVVVIPASSNLSLSCGDKDKGVDPGSLLRTEESPQDNKNNKSTTSNERGGFQLAMPACVLYPCYEQQQHTIASSPTFPSLIRSASKMSSFSWQSSCYSLNSTTAPPSAWSTTSASASYFAACGGVGHEDLNVLPTSSTPSKPASPNGCDMCYDVMMNDDNEIDQHYEPFTSQPGKDCEDENNAAVFLLDAMDQEYVHHKQCQYNYVAMLQEQLVHDDDDSLSTGSACDSILIHRNRMERRRKQG
jgi:hypothetical protein